MANTDVVHLWRACRILENSCRHCADLIAGLAQRLPDGVEQQILGLTAAQKEIMDDGVIIPPTCRPPRVCTTEVRSLGAWLASLEARASAIADVSKKLCEQHEDRLRGPIPYYASELPKLSWEATCAEPREPR